MGFPQYDAVRGLPNVILTDIIILQYDCCCCCSSIAEVGGPTGVAVDDKKKTLAELFRPPVDLMFQGDFAEVNK